MTVRFGLQIWCNIICDNTCNIARKHTIKLRYRTLFNGIAKTPKDNFDPIEIQKCSTSVGRFLLSLGEQLSLPYRASEVIFDSEVHGVSELSPKGEVKDKLNFTRA